MKQSILFAFLLVAAWCHCLPSRADDISSLQYIYDSTAAFEMSIPKGRFVQVPPSEPDEIIVLENSSFPKSIWKPEDAYPRIVVKYLAKDFTKTDEKTAQDFVAQHLAPYEKLLPGESKLIWMGNIKHYRGLWSSPYFEFDVVVSERRSLRPHNVREGVLLMPSVDTKWWNIEVVYQDVPERFAAQRNLIFLTLSSAYAAPEVANQTQLGGFLPFALLIGFLIAAGVVIFFLFPRERKR